MKYALVRTTAVLLLLIASPLQAQIRSRPTDPPLVTAANESWFQLGEPILFAGDLYYRAGAAVFFDGNVMVRSGYYNGVPIYVDATMEPFSVVLLPVRLGLMQPYERIRRGDLAGTTGSRTPGFPVRVAPENLSPMQQAVAPTNIPLPVGALPASEVTAPTRFEELVQPMVTERSAPAPARASSSPMVSITPPESNQGVWIHYQGVRWVSAGPAVPLRSTEFRAIGQYEGFPVFVRKDEQKTIYLPTRGGLVAPYKAQ